MGHRISPALKIFYPFEKGLPVGQVFLCQAEQWKHAANNLYFVLSGQGVTPKHEALKVAAAVMILHEIARNDVV